MNTLSNILATVGVISLAVMIGSAAAGGGLITLAAGVVAPVCLLVAQCIDRINP